MLFPVHLTVCFNFLFLWASNIEADSSDSAVCRDIDTHEGIFEPEVDDISAGDIDDDSRCFLFYSTNVLNCSWSLDHLTATQIVPRISVCDAEWETVNGKLLQSWNNFTNERVGSASFSLEKVGKLNVVFQFSIDLQGSKTVYTKMYYYDSLEAPTPPRNISASLKDKNLLVTWSLPESRVSSKSSCFQYQLAIGDGEEDRSVSEKLSYTVVNVDPSQTYRVRMRASLSNVCQHPFHWSEWSHVSIVEPAGYRLSLLVILPILLGIPMILLALLLVLRHQRVHKTLFPPIPSPPPKYLHFLEKNGGSNMGNLRSPAEEEEIAVVLYE